MKLSNEVAVPIAPDELFALLQDVERIAPCVPGARLEGRDGEEYSGSAKIKVGPIAVSYKGTAAFASIDPVARHAVLVGRGTELTGGGGAEATVDVRVVPEGTGSRIIIDTDLSIRGKVAQFGRGILGDVSQNLVHQFATNLSHLQSGSPITSGTVPGDVHAVPTAATDSLDGISLVLGPVVRRYGPPAVAFAAGVLGGVLAIEGLRRRSTTSFLPATR
jgi:carbon monoxide dehydrogenase subunit G